MVRAHRVAAGPGDVPADVLQGRCPHCLLETLQDMNVDCLCRRGLCWSHVEMVIVWLLGSVRYITEITVPFVFVLHVISS